MLDNIEIHILNQVSKKFLGKKMKIVLFLLIVSLPIITYSQELNCSVNVNYESVPPANKDYLTGFSSAVQDYMNRTKFTDQNWEGDKIVCSLNIYFTGATSDVAYTAQIVVSSQRPIYKSTDNSPILQINDGQWSFTYQKDQPLQFNPSAFDPLTSLLDFYAYTIIGMDMDTWQELGGTPYFSKAFDLVNMGSSSSFSQGWNTSTGTYSRKGLINDILNEKYRPLRDAIYDYYYGIDIFAQNKKVGQEKIVKLINTLNSMRSKLDINSVFVKVFFDAKSGEIVDRLKDYPDKNIFKILERLDPPHTAKYDQALQG